MCTRRDTTINHVTVLAEELSEYKSYMIFFRFCRTINIMSVYYFLINNSNGQDTNSTILYTLLRRGITLATGTKRRPFIWGNEPLPSREFFKIILSNLILCI